MNTDGLKASHALIDLVRDTSKDLKLRLEEAMDTGLRPEDFCSVMEAASLHLIDLGFALWEEVEDIEREELARKMAQTLHYGMVIGQNLAREVDLGRFPVGNGEKIDVTESATNVINGLESVGLDIQERFDLTDEDIERLKEMEVGDLMKELNDISDDKRRSRKAAKASANRKDWEA